MEPDEHRRGAKYGWPEWRADGFRGRPPWRRGYQPRFLAISLVLFFGLLTVVVLASSGRL